MPPTRVPMGRADIIRTTQDPRADQHKGSNRRDRLPRSPFPKCFRGVLRVVRGPGKLIAPHDQNRSRCLGEHGGGVRTRRPRGTRSWRARGWRHDRAPAGIARDRADRGGGRLPRARRVRGARGRGGRHRRDATRMHGPGREVTGESSLEAVRRIAGPVAVREAFERAFFGAPASAIGVMSAPRNGVPVRSGRQLRSGALTSAAVGSGAEAAPGGAGAAPGWAPSRGGQLQP